MQPLKKRRKWFSLAAVNIGNFCPPLDTGIMSFIVPTLGYDLKAPPTVALWVPLESLIITAAFMPIFGRFSDSHGRKRYFLLGLALFSLGAYLSGNSQTIYELLVNRLVQATGGAFILSNGRALIVDAFEPAKRGLALGTHISTLYVGMTVGVALTSSILPITQTVGWTYFAVLVVYAAHYGTLILLSCYLDKIVGLTPLAAGLVLSVEPLFVTIFAVFGGWVASRTSSRDPAIAGLVIVTFALVLMTTLAESTTTTTLSFLLAMLGAGVGIFRRKDRKSTRLNSSHSSISYAVFCLKKKK